MLVVVVYLLIGLGYDAASLYCYNMRNSDTYGGFSLPPLFLLGLPLAVVEWPLDLRSRVINGVGPFGLCTASPP